MKLLKKLRRADLPWRVKTYLRDLARALAGYGYSVGHEDGYEDGWTECEHNFYDNAVETDGIAEANQHRYS